MRLLPLYRERGGQDVVVAFTAVSDYDFERLCVHRWRLLTTGYAGRFVPRDSERRQRVQLVHRVVMGVDGAPAPEVDHINHRKLDNTRENLRLVTRAQNAQNNCCHRGSSSRYRGVYWTLDRRRKHGQGRWRAKAVVAGRLHHLGYFDTEAEAGKVASEFRAQHMPFSVEA